MNSRKKGAAAERELARVIHDHLGVRLVRNLEQSRRGGHDLIPYPDQGGPVAVSLARYAIEAKRYSRTTPHLLRGWWAQTCVQAERVGLTHATDRTGWTGAWCCPCLWFGRICRPGMGWTGPWSCPSRHSPP